MLGIKDEKYAKEIFDYSKKPFPDLFITNIADCKIKKIGDLGNGAYADSISVKITLNGSRFNVAQKKYKSIKSDYSAFFKEVYTLNSMHHPSIIKLIGWSILSDEGYIFMELADASLEKLYSQDSQICYPIFMYGVLHALKYQVDVDIVHKDIKKENILCIKREFSSLENINEKLREYFEDNSLYIPAIADYNSSEKVDETGVLKDTRLGQLGYINEFRNKTLRKEEVDIYLVNRMLKGMEIKNHKLDTDINKKTKEIINDKYKEGFQAVMDELNNLILYAKDEDDPLKNEYYKIQKEVFIEYKTLLNKLTYGKQKLQSDFLANLNKAENRVKLMDEVNSGNFESILTAAIAFKYGINVPVDKYQSDFLFAEVAKIRSDIVENFFGKEVFDDNFIEKRTKGTMKELIRDAKLQIPIAEARLGIVLAQKYFSSNKKENEKLKKIAIYYLEEASKKEVDLIAVNMALAMLYID